MSAAEHQTYIEQWHTHRIEQLMQPDGWLTLAGLFWLVPGENTFGSDSTSRFVYARADENVPARIGSFLLDSARVTFQAGHGVRVTRDSTTDATAVTLLTMRYGGDTATVLRFGSLSWLVIARGGRLAIRLRDAESPVRMFFSGINRFEVSKAWRFPARFHRRQPPDTIEVPNILGDINRTPSPGSVTFRYQGRRYELLLWEDSDDPANFFTAFGDRTNGGETYGGGRFLWVDAPDANGWTVVDFNKAYNPPCVFTEFATCPLPPRQNRLPFAVQAGEKSVAGQHH